VRLRPLGLRVRLGMCKKNYSLTPGRLSKIPAGCKTYVNVKRKQPSKSLPLAGLQLEGVTTLNVFEVLAHFLETTQQELTQPAGLQ